MKVRFKRYTFGYFLGPEGPLLGVPHCCPPQKSWPRVWLSIAYNDVKRPTALFAIHALPLINAPSTFFHNKKH